MHSRWMLGVERFTEVCVAVCIINLHCTLYTILLIHSRFREGPALDYLQFRDERISISDRVRSLGVILDKHMTFDDQIDHVCKSSIQPLKEFI